MLLQLPEELLTAVIEYLGVRELTNLACVARALQVRCQSSLYRDVVFTYEAHNQSGQQPLRSFVQAILCLPERAKLVKTLTFITHAYSYVWDNLDPLASGPLVQCLPKTFSLSKVIIGELATGGERSIDAAVAFLLHSLIALRALRLAVHPSDGASNSITGSSMMLTNAMIEYKLTPEKLLEQPLDQFSSLETIQLCAFPTTYDDLVCANVQELICLFHLPKIKYMTICLHDDDNKLLDWPRQLPQLPLLHTLNLRYSNVRLIALGQVLAKMPNLKRFEYIFCGSVLDDAVPLARKLLACDKLRKAIEVRANTLEQLILSVGFYDQGFDPDLEDLDNIHYGLSGSLGDLREFERLTYLKAPLVMLLGWDNRTSQTLDAILPETLEDFCCTDDLSDAFSYLWTSVEAGGHIDALRSRRQKLRTIAST
ncbi:MAG: hypothetical protein Q9216_000395 [Gyalolechia sp. 2 TL-2023]